MPTAFKTTAFANGSIVEWTLTGDEQGDWAEMIGSVRSVEVKRAGAPTSGNCSIEGSNAKLEGSVLHGQAGGELKFGGGDKLATIAEATRFIRPVVSGVEDSFTIIIMVIR